MLTQERYIELHKCVLNFLHDFGNDFSIAEKWGSLVTIDSLCHSYDEFYTNESSQKYDNEMCQDCDRYYYLSIRIKEKEE